MLYLDYSRRPGEWIPNPGRRPREPGRASPSCASSTRGSTRDHPDVQVFAEESTAFPGVSRPVDARRVGFGLKWDMGWMHDTLEFLSRDPIHRRHHQGELTFRSVYAYSENFILPLSHDEVVHGKGSLLTKMPGDDWQRFANLRLLYSVPVRHARQEAPLHGRRARPVARVGPRERAWTGGCSGSVRTTASRRLVADLNRLHRGVAALHELDTRRAGLRLDPAQRTRVRLVELPALLGLRRARPRRLQLHTVIRTERLGGRPARGLLARAPQQRRQRVRGQRRGKPGRDADAHPLPNHGMPHTLTLTVPPLGCLFLQPR